MFGKLFSRQNTGTAASQPAAAPAPGDAVETLLRKVEQVAQA